MRDENSIRYFMENETLIHNVIPFLKEQEMLALMCVNKRVCTAVHSAPHLPYLSTPFLSKMLSEHKAPVRVYVDNYNCFMTKNDDVTVSYRHAFNTPCVPPYMPIRKNISVLNIPIHHDYNIDLSTFPHLTKLVVTVFSQPHQDLPPLVLKSFHVHLSSANDIPSLNRMTKVISPTTVYLRSPRSYNIAEIKAIMPGAVVVTPKLYDISQLSKVHYVLDSIQIETKTVSCFSLHAEMAFDNNNDFIKQRMIQSACVYGSLKSIPTTPLRFTDIILFGVTLPSSGQLSFVGAKNLSVYKCSNISTLHFDKCDLQSLTFSRNSCLSCFRIPSTITSLDASQWKPVTIPNFKFLRNLCLSNCPTFRHLSIPFSVTSLTLKNCEKIRKISTQNLILQKMELENVGELKSLYFPTTLVDLTLDSVALPVCDCSSLLKLTKLVVSNCPKLTKITITNEISSLEISSCELLTSFVLPQLRINDLLISAC
ncbi:hypothetical protein EIN_059200, partial [Entamoeba invadens IP1]|uniref:hypothetical protein n=1 Tax=Entamoeba invadens IP1 TaxID=370355 RepID=UPI0002C3DF7B